MTGPVTLATMMTRPQPRLVMAGSAALVTRHAVVRLRASDACQVGRLMGATVPDSETGLAAAPWPGKSQRRAQDSLRAYGRALGPAGEHAARVRGAGSATDAPGRLRRERIPRSPGRRA